MAIVRKVQKSEKNTEERKTFKEFLNGCIISIALCFMLFIYAPLELYIYNKNEFWFDIYKLFPVIAVVFGGSVAICISVLALGYIVRRVLFQSLLIIYFITFIATYIQGNFLASKLPHLDGTEIDWNQYVVESIKSFILWVAITLFTIVLIRYIRMKKFYKVASITGICISCVLFITIISIYTSNEGYKKKMNLSITNENMFEMSYNANFIILVLDALDARSFTTLLNTTPEYQTLFADFTYYPNMVSAYPFTKHSIPFIFSGDWYENDEPFEEYSINVYKNAHFFTQLDEMKYKMGVYETELPIYDESVCRFENVKNDIGKVESWYEFARLEMMLVGIKYAPYSLKKYCLFDMNEFSNLRTMEELSLFNTDDLNFYDDVNSMNITYTHDKCFKFIHLNGAHVPFQYDKNLNIVENGTYEGKVEACLTLTNAYLKKLKQGKVYDNSVIIIMADHGFNGETETFGRHNPIFLAKGINEKHDMNVSNAPVSFEDLQEAYTRLLEGVDSTAIFEWKEGDKRERRFLFYYYLEDKHMVEYMETGDASDLDSMLPTGREFNYEE